MKLNFKLLAGLFVLIALVGTFPPGARAGLAIYSPNFSSDSNPGESNGEQQSTPEEISSVRKKRWFIGLTYPGITAGYQGNSFALELRGYRSGNTTIYGPRFTNYVYSFRGGNLYWGIDLYSVSEFEGDLTRGDGYMAGGIIGLQKYIGSRFSFTLDSGPYYIKLEDDLSGLDNSGVEFVINTGLNIHF